MNRVALRRLTLYNFRSFQGEHAISFPDSGLVIVRGNNRDTGGDSGAGKTNVLLAIAYLFGFCRHSAKALQCWYDDTPFYAEAVLDTPEGEVTIRRGAKGLSIGKLRGKSAEEKLDAMCGVPTDLREALTYRDQIRPLRFLAMKDKEMKEFLFQVLGLGSLEQEIAQRTKLLGELERQASFDEQQIKIWEESVAGRLDEPEPPVLEQPHDLRLQRQQHQSRAQLLAQRVSEVEDELASVPDADQSEVENLRKLVAEADRYITIMKATERGRLQAWEEELAVLRQELRQLEELVSRASRFREKVKQLRSTARKLEDDLCAMCSRPWEAAQAKLAEVEREISVLETQTEDDLRESERIPEVQARLAAHEFVPDKRLDQLRAAREGLLVQLAKASQAVQDATRLAAADVRQRLAEARQAHAEAQREASQAQAALDTLLERNRAKQKTFDEAVEVRQKALKRQLWYRDQVEKSQSDYRRESDYLDLLRGFRNKIFDEVLVSIGAEASKMIASLPNAQHITIEFESERQTDKGAVQERITPVVLLHGQQRPLDESVSGGQLTSLMLAVDLAVVRVISARLGCDLNWIILDEAFDGHDPVTKAGCVEMLQTYARDKLVVIVDHASEFKESFSKMVVVDHNQKASRFS